MKPAFYKPKYEESHALVIGINDYAFASPLYSAVSDAQAIANILKNTFLFKGTSKNRK